MNDCLPVPSYENLVIAGPAGRGAGTGFSSDTGVEEEVIVLVGGGVLGLAVERFGHQAEGLELAQDVQVADPGGHCGGSWITRPRVPK